MTTSSNVGYTGNPRLDRILTTLMFQILNSCFTNEQVFNVKGTIAVTEAYKAIPSACTMRTLMHNSKNSVSVGKR